MKKDWMIKESVLKEDDYQVKVLDAVLDKSCIVEGCAGSGKSILALVKAKQIQKERGNDYKIIGFTKSLCGYMNSGKSYLGLHNRISDHWHWKWIRYEELDNDGNVVWVQKPYKPTADYIIVDEIQDYTQAEIQEIVSATNKNFFFFGDTAQSVFNKLKKGTLRVDQIKQLVQGAQDAKEFTLFYNYRLPKPVAKFVQKIGINLPPYNDSVYKSVENEMPRVIQYNSFEEQLKAIYQIVHNTNLKDVGIFLPTKVKVKETYDRLKALGGNYEVKYDDEENWHKSINTLDFNSENPKVMTYQSAKGLQFETVFLPNLEDFDDFGDTRTALYVAMTRTYKNLYIMYSGKLPNIISANVDPSLYKTKETDTINDF